MKFESDIEARLFIQSHSPIGDFDNLEIIDVYYILEDTFNSNSPIQFQDVIDNETLDQIPLFRIAEDLIKIVQREKQLKMTPKGALPRKYLIELYEKKHLLDEGIEAGISKLNREIDCISLLCVRLVTQLSSLIKKSNGALTLTKSANKFLEKNDRAQIFKIFFKSFTTKYEWGLLDGFPLHSIGQIGWAYTCILLNKYGDIKKDVEFYSDKYAKAFPYYYSAFNEVSTNSIFKFSDCYSLRTFERFLNWFGLVELDYKHKGYIKEINTVKLTELFDKLFKFKYAKQF